MCGDAFLESTSCSCASYISSYFSCCELERVHPCPFIFCTSQSHSSLHLVMLVILSTICRVWNFISSRTGQTEPYLSGQETFRRAFTDSKPGRPILRLSTSQVLQEFVHRLSGQQGIYPPHFSQKSLAFRLQSLLNLNIPFLSPEQSDFAQSSSSSSQKQLSFTEIWRTTTPHGC